MPSGAGLVLVAVMECAVGLSLLTGRYLRQAVWLLAATMVGILSPLVLLTGQLFSGPHRSVVPTRTARELRRPGAFGELTPALARPATRLSPP